MSKKTDSAPKSEPAHVSDVPTHDEITFHRRVMQGADHILRQKTHNYSDEEVINSLLEPDPETGGTPLHQDRALNVLLSGYAGEMV